MTVRFDDTDRLQADTLEIAGIRVDGGEVRINGERKSKPVATVAGVGLGVAAGSLERILSFPAGSLSPKFTLAEGLSISLLQNNAKIDSVTIKASVIGGAPLTFVQVSTLFRSTTGSPDPSQRNSPAPPGALTIASNGLFNAIDFQVADGDGNALGIPAYRGQNGTPEAVYKVSFSILSVDYSTLPAPAGLRVQA